MCQDRRKLFYGGGVSVKMSATMVYRLQKILKKNWQKQPKAVPEKMKIGPKHK